MMGDIIRTLKLEPIWIDPEDKERFNRIMFNLAAKEGRKFTQADTFKFILSKLKEDNNAAGT